MTTARMPQSAWRWRKSVKPNNNAGKAVRQECEEIAKQRTHQTQMQLHRKNVQDCICVFAVSERRHEWKTKIVGAKIKTIKAMRIRTQKRTAQQNELKNEPSSIQSIQNELERMDSSGWTRADGLERMERLQAPKPREKGFFSPLYFA